MSQAAAISAIFSVLSANPPAPCPAFAVVHLGRALTSAPAGARSRTLW